MKKIGFFIITLFAVCVVIGCYGFSAMKEDAHTYSIFTQEDLEMSVKASSKDLAIDPAHFLSYVCQFDQLKEQCVILSEQRFFAAAVGVPQCCFAMALDYAFGRSGVKPDGEMAYRMCERAADRGVSPAQLLIATYLIQDDNKAADYQQGEKMLLPLAEAGNSEAIFALYIAYTLNEKLQNQEKAANIRSYCIKNYPKVWEEGCKLYRLHFEHVAQHYENPHVWYVLALIYLNGYLDTPTDYETAMFWMRRSAREGHVQAKLFLDQLEDN